MNMLPMFFSQWEITTRFSCLATQDLGTKLPIYFERARTQLCLSQLRVNAYIKQYYLHFTSNSFC